MPKYNTICPVCNGTGNENNHLATQAGHCQMCHGTGRLEENDYAELMAGIPAEERV